MSAHTAALAAVLAVAVIAARALFLWLVAFVQALMRKARLFGWGAVSGALAAAAASAHAHVPAALAVTAAAAMMALIAVVALGAAARVLARPVAYRSAP